MEATEVSMKVKLQRISNCWVKSYEKDVLISGLKNHELENRVKKQLWRHLLS